jgi:predicted phage terminase large subunit-like protein
MSVAEYHAMLRNDFGSFLHCAFAELCPRDGYQTNWHLDVLADRLDRVRSGQIKRLIVNLPPRHLKSLAASVALPAFWLGHDPCAQIICASYGQELASKLSRDCRALMQSRFYKQLFATRLSKTKAAMDDFETTAHGFRLATSVGGVLTGRGADVLIVDDPLKPEEAVSKTARERANHWFDNTLYSRLNDKQAGAIVVIMQRLHEDDLVGHVLKQEPWEVLRFPAIAETDETFAYETVRGAGTAARTKGEALHPAREPLVALERVKKALGSYNFAGQYQQRPTPLEGGLVERAWFRTYEPEEARAPFERIVQSWDTANKASELADYSVCTTWGVRAKGFYLLHVLRRKLNYPELKRCVAAQQQAFAAQIVLIEDKASGTPLIQELRAAGVPGVRAVQPVGDKVMRLHAQTAAIENGFVLLPREAHWLEDYLEELTLFPRGAHDDQVDSTAQALAYLTTLEDGWLTFARNELERVKGRAR